MSNHTPGPWKANFAISGSVYIFGGDRNFVCVFNEWRDEANQEANARLIAAAPDLLDALRQWAWAEAHGDSAEIENARKARDAALDQVRGIND